MVRGYEIDFSSAPPIGHLCPPYGMDQTQQEALDQEITNLVGKKVVEKVKLNQLGFATPMFVVPKKNEKWRPVINLKLINQYIVIPHFKMEI